MSLDMTFNGNIGGSSGLLDWGGDIGRMWGLGMQNGIAMANALRDLKMRSELEPSYIEGAWMNNQLAKQNAQNQFTKAYDTARADSVEHGYTGGVIDPRGIQSYGGVVNTNPQTFQRSMSVAPRNTTNTVVGNGVGYSGHTNTAGSGGMNTGSPSMNTALQQGQYSQYGQGG